MEDLGVMISRLPDGWNLHEQPRRYSPKPETPSALSHLRLRANSGTRVHNRVRCGGPPPNLWSFPQVGSWRRMEEFAAGIVLPTKSDQFVDELLGIWCQVALLVPGEDGPSSNRQTTSAAARWNFAPIVDRCDLCQSTCLRQVGPPAAPPSIVSLSPMQKLV
jgi:hypothetical protein